MEDPYKKRLEEIINQKATIHRANAADLTGEVTDVSDDGCTIKQDGSRPDSMVNVFVAYKDIRGLGHETWNSDLID